ncbi:efflux RND transporter periplasmic adaptor subunit [Salinimonas chungwhensis]|uniref:efflux RND transporter periplasmic adaptor subunit n=1 Tax=Salinimonas chungwhensis TaxID=265425 RepID=UPI00037696BF|nr:efflux RND transporter periplasmic adaptor subunit [Salinimonas chungwhensis]
MFKKSQKKPVIIGLILVAVTSFAVWLIYTNEPVAEKDGATKRSAMLVNVMSAQKSQYSPTVNAMGEVVAARQVALRPRVTGTVKAVSDKFVPGNILQKGEWLVKLDSEDYELALQRAQSNLIQAQSMVDIEMGEQDIAKNDLATLDRDVPDKNRALILRKPQLNQVKADLQAAEVAVREAELALERTTIEMPFTGQIMSQDVNLGSQLSPSDVIANIIGTSRYWIETAVPSSQLKWLATSLESSEQDGSSAIITNESAWGKNVTRTGQVKEVIATLDTQTRMATVLVEVADPLLTNRQADSTSSNQPFAPLIAGSYVQVQLPAVTLENVFRIPITYLRKGDTVWLAQSQQLNVQEVSVIYRDDRYAYVDKGISAGDKIITTNLAAVRDGAAVRIEQDSASASKADNQVMQAKGSD